MLLSHQSCSTSCLVVFRVGGSTCNIHIFSHCHMLHNKSISLDQTRTATFRTTARFGLQRVASYLSFTTMWYVHSSSLRAGLLPHSVPRYPPGNGLSSQAIACADSDCPCTANLAIARACFRFMLGALFLFHILSPALLTSAFLLVFLEGT